MATFTSFNASTVPPQDVRSILRDYVALDQARMWRRLFVVRFGMMALVMFILGRLIQGLSAYGRWIPVILFLIPPVWAWCVELRLARQLSHRLDGPSGSFVHTVVMETDLR